MQLSLLSGGARSGRDSRSFAPATMPSRGLTAATSLSFAAAYFFLQVIYARRMFGISPPKTSGPPEFERIFRAQ